jgi:hypothetical protein
MPSGQDLVFYQFSRSKVERGDFSHFLNLYGRDKLPSGGRLRRMMGTFLFAIEGYDDDPREIYTIPEVRSFYRAFWETWPYWFFFTCLLENDALKPMTLCCLDDLSATQVDGQPMSCASLDLEALESFLAMGFTHLDEIGEQAGMFPDRVAARKQEVQEFFGLAEGTGTAPGGVEMS